MKNLCIPHISRTAFSKPLEKAVFLLVINGWEPRGSDVQNNYYLFSTFFKYFPV